VKASGNGSAAAKVTSTAAPKAAPKVALESASKTAAKPVAAAQTKAKAKVGVKAAVKSADTNKHSKPGTQQAEAPQATNSQPQTPLKSTPKTANRETNVAKTTSTPATKTAGNKSSAAKAPGKKKAGVGRIDAQPADFVPYARKKNEEYMNVEQRSHFKQILLDWKLQLMEEVDRTVNHMKDVAANDPDPADRATQEEEFSLELRTRDRERKLIRKIDSTIDLIDQNDYGYCESCGIEIGIQRLEARPTATQCIDCKTLDEIKERQIHG
jgi:DnaK suppressor protein